MVMDLASEWGGARIDARARGDQLVHSAGVARANGNDREGEEKGMCDSFRANPIGRSISRGYYGTAC
jgi:hypothetical protein